MWLHYLRRLQLPKILEYLNLSRTDSILDIGCGDGEITRRLKPSKLRVGCDIEIRSKAIEENLNFIEANALHLNFDDQSFDKILMSSVLQMIPEGRELLIEARRVLKDSGLLVLTIPSGLIYIPRLYSKRFIFKIIRKLFRLPETYEMFTRELCAKHKASGPAVISLAQLSKLANETQFVIEKSEYCPKSMGSFFYEMIVLIKHRLGRSVVASGYFSILFYPFGLIDFLLSKDSKGCEIIARLHKFKKL